MSETAIRGFPVVISAPSGGGKDTVAATLLKEVEFLKLSRSMTSRPMRTGESRGREYIFTTKEEFETLKAAGRFVETAEVHGHLYGTPKEFIEETCASGLCPLLVIDVQGGMLMKDYDPATVLIFLMPPSMRELEKRLRGRETDPPEEIKTRLENARKEIEMAPKYDYIIVNERLDQTVSDVRQAILEAWSKARNTNH